jgi:hypothetical protein
MSDNPKSAICQYRSDLAAPGVDPFLDHHVGIKEPFGDTIGIVIVIHMFMVAAVFEGPKDYGILKRSGSKNNREEPHNPMSLES